MTWCRSLFVIILFYCGKALIGVLLIGHILYLLRKKGSQSLSIVSLKNTKLVELFGKYCALGCLRFHIFNCV